MQEKKLAMRPLADRVIVEPIERAEKTKRGILMPESANGKPQEGLIVAVGSGSWNKQGDKRVEIQVAVGDKVVFAKHAGSEIKIRINKKKYLIMNEKDILAVLDE